MSYVIFDFLKLINYKSFNYKLNGSQTQHQ